MDSLPLEILHSICSYLEPGDVTEFRWISKSCAAVGLEYLIPVARVSLLPESIDKLKAISNHPVLSRRVHTLWFRPVMLKPIFGFKDFKKSMSNTGPSKDPFPELPPPYPTEREKRKFKIDMKRTTRNISSSRAKTAWLLYQDAMEEQRRLYDEITCTWWRAVLEKLPNLRSIHYSSEADELAPRQARRGEDPYDKFLHHPSQLWHWKDDFKPLVDALEGSQYAGLSLKELSMGEIRWTVANKLKNKRESSILSKRLQDLKRLKISICFEEFDDTTIAGEHIENELAWENYEIYKDSSSEDWLGSLAMNAPLLEDLSIRFQHLRIGWEFGITEGDEYPGRLDSRMKTFVWSNLQRLHLECFCVGGEEFVSFLAAHSSTLASIDLRLMHLTQPMDSWKDVFPKIGVLMVNLKEFQIQGRFTAEIDEGWDAGYEEIDEDRELANELEALVLRPLHKFSLSNSVTPEVFDEAMRTIGGVSEETRKGVDLKGKQEAIKRLAIAELLDEHEGREDFWIDPQGRW